MLQLRATLLTADHRLFTLDQKHDDADTWLLRIPPLTTSSLSSSSALTSDKWCEIIAARGKRRCSAEQQKHLQLSNNSRRYADLYRELTGNVIICGGVIGSVAVACCNARSRDVHCGALVVF